MRTAIYIDGFNFYYGAVKGTAYKWLNPKQLCETILKPHHNIISIVYCIARVKSKSTDPGAPIRQATYLKAIKSYIPELDIIYGHFLETKVLCRPVNPKYGNLIEVFRTEEKGSDVNLAVHLVNDAHKDIFDCAIIISNDSDLAEAMRIVKDEYGKIVGLFTPWRRYASKQLMRYSSFQRTIRKASLARSQLPNPIPGIEIYKPMEW
ncbi:MAG: NYN domain-containing protein [Gammaproteobacteria bacterium]|nr:NYN domain-containing protein [Gammaproteobacteria bacterium]